MFFVIEQHDFDNGENHCPYHSKPCAVALTIQEADAYIETLQRRKFYTGWDNQRYPQWRVQVVPNVRDAIEQLPPLQLEPELFVTEESGRFKKGARVKIEIENAWVEGRVVAACLNRPYPPGYSQTHGPALAVLLDTQVMTGWLPEEQFQPADEKEGG